MTRSTVAAVLLTLALLSVTTPSAAGRSQAAQQRAEKVLGYLQAYPGDCPPAEAPQDPYVCHEVVLSAWRVASDEALGAMAPPRTHWALAAVRHTLTFPGGGGDPTESEVVEGFTDHPTVTFDRQHLSTAHLLAQDVPMADGSTLDVEATWTATSPRFVYGNDGPSLVDFGRVRHLHEPCLNEISQGHQKFRLAHVHTVLNGVPVDDLSIFAFLASNQFRTTDVVPARCRR